MTILIVEGTDCSGKSTAIEKISKFFKRGLLLKNLYKPTHSNDYHIYSQYWSIINTIHAYCNTHENKMVIMDRFYPSQAVYSFLRGFDEMDDPEIRRLDRYCAFQGSYVYVYLDTPLEELYRRYDLRSDDYIKRNELSELKSRYDKFYDVCRLHRKIKINTMDPNWLEELNQFVKEAEADEY